MTKASEVEGQTVVFEVSSWGTVEAPKLKFKAYTNDKLTPNIERSVSDRISFFLSLQDNLRGFYKIALQDACMEAVIRRFYGHKQVKFLTPFEGACWAILAQRIPMAASHKMKENLVRAIGDPVRLGGVEYWAFPDAKTMAAAGEAKISQIVRNRRKAEYLWAVTEKFKDVEEQWLRSAPYDEVYTWLRGIKGIGEWSANFILLRSLGRMEKLSTVGPDLAYDVAKMYFGREEPLTDSEVCKIAEKYGASMGYWAYYVRIYSEFTYVFQARKRSE